MTAAEMYTDTRERLTALFRSLRPDQLATPVPSTPRWTVKDVAGHLAGAADDVLAGRIDGAATDPWTAKQVEARADVSIAAILDEWTQTGPQLAAIFDAAGAAAHPLVIDVVTHEHDVRGALGMPGGRDTDAADWVLQRLVAGVDARLREARLASLRIKAGNDEWILGAAAPAASAPAAILVAEPFELLRALIGRRSVAQLRAYAWEGDAEPYLGRLTVFPPSESDIIE